MKLVADEGVDGPIVERLRADGHQIWYMAEIAQRTQDEDLLALANQEDALLMAIDKDFGELVYRQNLVHSGVILIRLEGLSASTKADIVSRVMADHASEFPRSFTVISPGHVRIRRRRL